MGLLSSSKSHSALDQVTDAGLTGVAEDSNLSQSRASLSATDVIVDDGAELNIYSTTTDLGAVEGSLALAGQSLGYGNETFATAADLLEDTYSRAIGANEETFRQSLNFAGDAVGDYINFAENAFGESLYFADDANSRAINFAENAFDTSAYLAEDAYGRSINFAQRALDAVAGQGGIIDRQTEAVQGTLSDVLGQQTSALSRVVESQGETNAERIEQLTKIALYAGAALAAVWIFKG